LDELRLENSGPLLPCRDVCRQDSKKRQAGRNALRTTHEVQPGDQQEDREGNRIRDSPGTAVARRQGDRMRTRREFLFAGGAGVCVLASLWRSRTHQSGKVWRIGFLHTASRESAMSTGRYPAFLDGMRKLGYV